MKESYLFRAAEAGPREYNTVYQEGLTDLSKSLTDLVNSYHDADLPLVVAAMEITADSLKKQLIPEGRDVYRHIISRTAAFLFRRER